VVAAPRGEKKKWGGGVSLKRAKKEGGKKKETDSMRMFGYVWEGDEVILAYIETKKGRAAKSSKCPGSHLRDEGEKNGAEGSGTTP